MRVRAIILSESGRLLLGINQADEYMLPGGKIKEGEHPVDALLREVHEETNIDKFESIEYLWKYLDNYIFIFIPVDSAFQPSCFNDPSEEFKSLEWVNIEALPQRLDEYTEQILYRFLRLEILRLGKKEEEGMKKNLVANHIDVMVDGEKAFQLDDDTIWLTLPRLASERAKGKKIEFKQVWDDSDNRESKKEKKPTKSVDKSEIKSCLLTPDVDFFNKYVRLDLNSELLNPSVSILKVADCFDNTLLFNGSNDFWITNQNKPVWRGNFSDRFVPYADVVATWNVYYPEHTIDLSWLKEMLKKLFNVDKEDGCGKEHCTKVVCIECGAIETCRCKTPKKEKKGVCSICMSKKKIQKDKKKHPK